jgi:NadR type nicotinamide-nucleotide adenylyltransferase
MKRGIVIGKFYPPHKGHKHLIEAGLSQVDELTVIVCDKVGQTIPGDLRAKWLREMVPPAHVLVVPDVLPEDDSKAWAAYTLRILGYRPDVVFTSEDYGSRYATFMGSQHVLVDKARQSVPISATQIRENPLAHWEYLDPCVRGYFAKRVCAVGAESTGTTTIAQSLAAHFQTTWVPEFGRLYYEGKMHAQEASLWRTDEFVFIAREQNRIEDELAKTCNKILICDTDAFATSLWHEYFLGFTSAEVDAVSHNRRYDLYLLTDADIPFVQDGTREGERKRLEMHHRFEEELQRRNKAYLLLSGSHEQRRKTAVEACEEILSLTTKSV